MREELSRGELISSGFRALLRKRLFGLPEGGGRELKCQDSEGAEGERNAEKGVKQPLRRNYAGTFRITEII